MQDAFPAPIGTQASPGSKKFFPKKFGGVSMSHNILKDKKLVSEKFQNV
jgi:hypothetical protein